MITLFRASDTYTLKSAHEAMAAQIKQLPNKVSFIGSPKKLFRFEFECESVNLLDWLHNQQAEEKIYWSDRNHDFEMAGCGVADIIEGEGNANYKDVFDHMEERLSSDNPQQRYYGGFCFDHTSLDSLWSKYGSYRFVIPRFELFSSNGKLTFAFNTKIEDISDEKIQSILSELENLDCSLETNYRKVPKILDRTDCPNQTAWNQIFQKIFDDKNKCIYEKIVLARRSTFQFDVNIRPSALIKHLKDQTPNCFHFCFQVAGHNAFLGATPERLFKRDALILQSEAVAGTTKRGESDSENQKLEQDLLNSSKYKQEHSYVHDAIDDAFQDLCSSFRSDDQASLLKLLNGQHLVTRFQGELNKKVYDTDILKALHPTPAVAGIKKSEAINAIKEIEPFSRGWYAGPIGYIGHDVAEFAVAIRSGLVHENNLSLYAGAGIVEGSKQEEEWEEIENKISSFMKVFEK